MNLDATVELVDEVMAQQIPRAVLERLALFFLFSGKYKTNPCEELIQLCLSGVDLEEWLESSSKNNSLKRDDISTKINSTPTLNKKTLTRFSPNNFFISTHDEHEISYGANNSTNDKNNKPANDKNNKPAKDKNNYSTNDPFYFEPQKQCAICLMEYPVSEMYTVNCKESHRFCFECFKHHVEAKVNEGQTVPCPGDMCDYVLQPSDLEEIGMEQVTYRKYEILLLNRALQTMNAIGCPTRNCGNYIVPREFGEQEMCECSKCKAVFCSLCQRKYHFRTDCSEVETVEKVWIWWNKRGREENWRKKAAVETQYRIHLQTFIQAKGAHDKALHDLQNRMREEEEDEQWKAKNCRQCPNCSRAINKIEGCDSMRCGTDYHGGNAQNGCGHKFLWREAPHYQPKLNARNTPTLAIQSPDEITTIDNGPYTCEICDSPIKGLRFSCLYCKMYDVCEECEMHGLAIHNNHIFKIVNLQKQ